MDNREVDPLPLNFMFHGLLEVSDWVIDTVKAIKKFVGLECEGYEEHFMALLTAIEAGHKQQRKASSKKQRELKRLM